ncbi:MAG TPA: ester cyclase [Candidatus Binataceae bacterium]|nr:ester cyclase [Candidatus Binataceae bacterium]
MDIEKNKELVRQITEQLWNGRAYDKIPEFYAEDYVADYSPYAIHHGLEGIRGMVERAYTTFTDYHEELREMIAEGDMVVLRITISGFQTGQWGPLPPSGKRVEFDEAIFLRLRDGKVVHQRGIVDNLAALRQLGRA